MRSFLVLGLLGLSLMGGTNLHAMPLSRKFVAAVVKERAVHDSRVANRAAVALKMRELWASPMVRAAMARHQAKIPLHREFELSEKGMTVSPAGRPVRGGAAIQAKTIALPLDYFDHLSPKIVEELAAGALKLDFPAARRAKAGAH